MNNTEFDKTYGIAALTDVYERKGLLGIHELIVSLLSSRPKVLGLS